MTSMKSRKRKWFLALVVVGALAVGLAGGGTVLAQMPWQHGVQHERPLDRATEFGPGHHSVPQERSHGEQH